MSTTNPPSVIPRPVPGLALPTIAMCFGYASAVLTVAYLFIGWFTALLGASCGVVGMAIGLTILFSRRRTAGRKMAAAAGALSAIGLALFFLEIVVGFHLF